MSSLHSGQKTCNASHATNTAHAILQAWKRSCSFPSTIFYTKERPKTPITFTELVCLTCFLKSSSKRRKEKAAAASIVFPIVSLSFGQKAVLIIQPRPVNLSAVSRVNTIHSCQILFYHFNILQALIDWLPNHLFQNNSRNCCCTG